LKGAHPEVAWQPAARLRNRIVHGYWDIDVETLVAAATDDIPTLTIQLENVITSLAQHDEADNSDFAD
jgi:uncharacterized protein with HEPN domain